MEPSKEAIAVRVTRLNRQILGKVTSGSSKLCKKIDRESLLDAITVLYDECNEDPVKKCDELVRIFLDKYRSTLAELRRARVCVSDFETIQTIGRGHYGEVQMVREKQTGDVYALKSVRKDEARKRVSGAEDERDILANGTGQWIPRLQYAFQDSSNLYLVMELCNGGDLAGLLARRNHPLSERDAAFYIAEVAHALKALHAMGYVHRDVKPQNILLDRCGHVKLGDFGSCARLSEGGCVTGATADYVAPELLDDCSGAHTVCLEYCRRANTAISACDYWSLGVVAFEMVTLKRPFSSDDDDTVAQILSNIQKYERDCNAVPPFEPLPNGPSNTWRALVSGLLRVSPSRRYNYLDTLQHPALAHLALHAIRDQVPPWVPHLRGPEDASFLPSPTREPSPPSAAPFRTRPPFAGHLPFIGYSYVAPDENEDSSGGFNASHDCTTIDLATFKSAEKLAAMRGREVASLQSKLAAAEAATNAAVEKARRHADADAETRRAKLQAEITALSLQNKRLERQIEVEKEERMALQRTNQELRSGIAERTNQELRAVQNQASELQAERDLLKSDLARVEARMKEVQVECSSAVAAADNARAQHKHYKDTVAKERAIRRQTLSGGEADGARVATAEANAAREQRARREAEARLASAEQEVIQLRAHVEQLKEQLNSAKESVCDKERVYATTSQQLSETQVQLAQERMRCSSLAAQVQELEKGVNEAAQREAALEEQSARTEARLQQRLEAAEARAAAALRDDARHREKVNTLEQLVRQLEREVSALENRSCTRCVSKPEGAVKAQVTCSTNTEEPEEADANRDNRSDTESVTDAHVHAHVSVLKEQLERAEAQLQARAEEIAALRQETRAANLARWRKEKEFNDLSLDAKITARELKRVEERLASALEARRSAEEKAGLVHKEITTIKPQYEQTKKEVEKLKEQVDKLQKTNQVLQAEVDRSRNDIRKLKSEVQYSEKRRLHAEEQEELSSRERAQLRDELAPLRAQNNDLVQNNKALQEACSLLEEQLTDLEKLADLHELKNKDLESEMTRIRSELESCRSRLAEAERQRAERAAAAALAEQRGDEAREQLKMANSHLQILRERLDNRESLLAELEGRVAKLESELASRDAALGNAGRRVRDLQEECAALRTRAHHHHSQALQLQASLAEAQEEAEAAREAHAAAAAWWRTRETKADATLRQQAKLIDFLQAKVEEAGRKKCSLSNKLFGRSGRRTAASPPLLRVNRELREEVERLRAKLAAANANGEANFMPTPRRERKEKPKIIVNGAFDIDTPDGNDDSLLIIWSDGSRERMQARAAESTLLLRHGEREMRARLVAAEARDLPHNEANRAFTIKLENSDHDAEAIAVCSTIAARTEWLNKLAPASSPGAGYEPPALLRTRLQPATALYVAPNVLAIGCLDGLHSLRGPIRIEWEGDVSPPRRSESCAVQAAAAAAGRALLVCGGLLAHTSLLALGSALRRATSLRPVVTLARVQLPDSTAPHLVKGIADVKEGHCAAVACGRRVFLLRFDAANAEFKIARSLTVDRAPYALLLTQNVIYIAGEKPLKVNLPSGTLEAFAMDEPVVAAAFKKHSAPKAIVQIRSKPVEILLCYDECGVFVDGNGKRTRNEDPMWSTAVHAWEYVSPFLYAVGEDRVTIIYIHDDTYRAPPCTCDSTSLASSASECYQPDIFNYKCKEPLLLGTAPNGIIIKSKVDDEYKVSIIEGKSAFKSMGTSLDSLATISDSKGSSTSDLAQSSTDLAPQDVSQESVELTTGFLADIRKRAQQLRAKHREERSADDVIKEILTTEVGLKRTSNGRRSPAVISEFDSDSESESEEGTGSTKCTADLCAEMFSRRKYFTLKLEM
ncbi:citron rho-interacting kinase isoform X4 [Maniola jurtina]|uniref:citron rho-interacting kinase isoform X4 n=1 Tax=Maniola jurtina TaxID=191418 RepID=UPI001E68C609|nr:citron rho-interacting kinase isoform X4 [Maniola jurtina]